MWHQEAQLLGTFAGHFPDPCARDPGRRSRRTGSHVQSWASRLLKGRLHGQIHVAGPIDPLDLLKMRLFGAHLKAYRCTCSLSMLLSEEVSQELPIVKLLPIRDENDAMFGKPNGVFFTYSL